MEERSNPIFGLIVIFGLVMWIFLFIWVSGYFAENAPGWLGVEIGFFKTFLAGAGGFAGAVITGFIGVIILSIILKDSEECDPGELEDMGDYE